MATINLHATSQSNQTAYRLVRRAQASIAGYRHYDDGDLARYLERDSFQTMAELLAQHYFHRSTDLALYGQVQALMTVLLVMAPILQRLPLSSKFDWHRGHIVGWFRRHANGRVARFHCGIRTIERVYDPALFAANLEAIGLHDAAMREVLCDLYRRHAGGTTLKDQLAHQLFDPVTMLNMREGFELRHANRFYRLEKVPFADSTDLRLTPADVLDYQVHSVAHHNGHHLEIMIAEHVLVEFRAAIKSITAMSASPQFKVSLIADRIRDLVERTRPARSALPQIRILKTWLAHKLRPLSGTTTDAKRLPDLLLNQWLQRVDHRLHLRAPNFFLSPDKVDRKTFTAFFSPYREV
ncbi:MAG TPA: hypothetical protein VIH45_09825 [Desulfuromonadaceae bacterium]